MDRVTATKLVGRDAVERAASCCRVFTTSAGFVAMLAIEFLKP